MRVSRSLRRTGQGAACELGCCGADAPCCGLGWGWACLQQACSRRCQSYASAGTEDGQAFKQRAPDQKQGAAWWQLDMLACKMQCIRPTRPQPVLLELHTWVEGEASSRAASPILRSTAKPRKRHRLSRRPSHPSALLRAAALPRCGSAPGSPKRTRGAVATSRRGGVKQALAGYSCCAGRGWRSVH
jgi:hypothetical protein